MIDSTCHYLYKFSKPLVKEQVGLGISVLQSNYCSKNILDGNTKGLISFDCIMLKMFVFNIRD